MKPKKSLAAAALATIAVAGVGGTAAATSGGSSAPSATSASSSSAGTDATKSDHGPGKHQHTAVTGTEASNVKAAVNAKYSGLTIKEVRKDPDGSYDVLATKSGKPAMYEVSKDLKTITERTGGPRDGKGGPGRHGKHTAASAAETTKVKAAIAAKYSGASVVDVFKDDDGSFVAFATKSGDKVMYKVSKDYQTVTERTGGPRGHAGDRGPAGAPGGSDGSSSGGSSAAPSTSGASA